MSWWTDARDGVEHIGHHISSGIDKLFGNINHAAGWEKPGDGPGIDGTVSFSTDTMTGPENQRIMTTAYNENGGEDMFGSNTAYNEEKEQGSWWDRNQSWLIPTITTLGTTAAGMIYNNNQQKKQNQFNANEAQKTRDFNLYMSNTAHQREMEDLVAAGLNPANTATGGQGAAGESGAQASGANPAYMGYGDMANTALSLAETMKALSENKYISKEKKAQIANTIADTTNKSANTEMTKAQKDLIKEQTKQINIDNISRDDMNKIEIALKTAQKKEVIENTIAQAIKNAYNTTTGTMPEQTTVERLTSLAASMLTENVKGKTLSPDKAIEEAIKRIREE